MREVFRYLRSPGANPEPGSDDADAAGSGRRC
jgi:hypothetical protein